MSSPPRIYLIDGYSNIFRAYYAIRGLSSSRGEPTNAVFGFLQMLRKLLQDEKPRYLGVALDVSSDTVRRDRYEGYKAHRAPMPDDLKPQIPWIRKLLEAYKVPLLELPKYEADDVLGTLATKAVAAGYEVVLVSPDKDLFQLVGDGVFQLHTTRERLYDAAGVEEDFGVPPAKVVDVLALVGDASDNVPGVPGIGDKGAKNLIGEYGSLDALIEHAGEIKRKSYREGLEQHREQALLSRELVTIHTDLDVDFEPDALLLSEPDFGTLKEICWQLDFKSLAREYEDGAGVEAEAVPAAAEVRSAEDWRRRTAEPGGEICVAVVGEPPAGLAVAVGDGGALWADFRSDGLEAAVRESLAAWLADPGVELVGHDLKEVLRLFAPRGPEVRCRLFDTMLGSYLARSALRGHDLDSVAQDRLHRTAMSAQDAGFRRRERPLAGDAQLLAYAAERVELPRRIAPELAAELEEGGLTGVYRRIEEPLMQVLADVEETGVLLDVGFLATMSGEMAGEIEGLEEKVYEQAGERFNVNSPSQLGEILFERRRPARPRPTRPTPRSSRSWRRAATRCRRRCCATAS
jgi:DNA polymerase-1